MINSGSCNHGSCFPRNGGPLIVGYFKHLGDASTRVLFLFVLLMVALGNSVRAETFCIDYEFHPNQANFRKFDFAILSPYSQADLREGHAMGKKFYAYISAGEVARSSQYYQEAQAYGVPFLTENPNWASMVVDQTSPKWAPFVVNHLARPAVDQGYDGFFLDTMDSYYLLSPWQTWAAQETGLVSMVRQLKAAYPNKKIIINRGFPLFDRLRDVVDGMLIEGLFYSYPGEVNEESDTEWLVGQLAKVKAAGRSVYVVDYMANAPSLAPQVAEQIADLGFSPLIVARSLDGTVLAPDPDNVNEPDDEGEGGEEEPVLERQMRVARVGRLPLRDGYPTLKFKAKAGLEYVVEWTENKRSGIWNLLAEIPAESPGRVVEVKDYSYAPDAPRRVYRLCKVLWR